MRNCYILKSLTKQGKIMNFNSVSDLLDYIIKEKQLKNDAALSRELEVSPPCISNLRKGNIKLGASLIIKIHELTGMSIAEIKSYLPSKDGE